jgi:hypothetical protein
MHHAGMLKVKWLAGGRLRRRLLAPPNTDDRSVQSAHVPRVHPWALYWRHHVCNTYDRAACDVIHTILIGPLRLALHMRTMTRISTLALWLKTSCTKLRLAFIVGSIIICFLLGLYVRFIFTVPSHRRSLLQYRFEFYRKLMTVGHRLDAFGTYVGRKLSRAWRGSGWIFFLS